MKKYILSIIIFLVLLHTATAQSSGVREFPMEENALLWRISGNNVHGDAFLFGTIHLIPAMDYFFPDTLKYINTHVDAIMLEIDLTADLSGMFESLLLEEGSLFDFFSEVQTDSLLTWAEDKLGFNESQFRISMGKMKPFVISTMAAASGTTEPTESYDMNISSNAKKAEIPVIGLETFQDQINMFDGFSREEQTAMVMSAIRDDSITRSMNNEMVELYLGQNVDSLFLFATGDSQHELDQAIFLDDRNKRWIPQIADCIAEKNTLIAVGAGHLGGPNGVIRLLEREGYTLTPIKL